MQKAADFFLELADLWDLTFMNSKNTHLKVKDS